MAENISGEFWFEIARRDFDVWCALTKTIRVFWHYVQKIGREKTLEKLFGRTKVTRYFSVMWFIANTRHRFGGLPLGIDPHGLIHWHSKDRSAGRNLISIDHVYMKFAESSHGVGRMMYYDGHYIIGDVSHNPDGSSTNFFGKTMTTLKNTYFSFGRHRYSVNVMGDSVILVYCNLASLRDQNLPKFLGRDGTFLSLM